MSKHKLTLAGTLAFIHAVTSFAQDWQNDNEGPDELEQPQTPVVQPNFGGVPVPTTEASETPKKTRESAKAKAERLAKEAEAEAASQPVQTVPLPDFLQASAAQPQTDPFSQQAAINAFQQAAPNPFAPVPDPSAQAWLTPAPAMVAAPAQSVVQGTPVIPALSELHQMLGVLANDGAHRQLVEMYFKSLGVANLQSVPQDKFEEAKSVFQRILSGEIHL